MNFPTELKYTLDHEWVRASGDEAFVGITDFAQRELGDIVYLDISSIGEELSKQAVFGTVEAVKTVSDLFMPVSGVVLEYNKLLDKTPELINTDPYGDGWMVKISLADILEFDEMLSAEDYQNQIGL